jgi:hypothetical protein
MDPQAPPPPPYSPQPGPPDQQPPQWGGGGPPQAPYMPVPQPQRKQSAGRSVIGSIVGTIVVIALIAGAYWLYRTVTNTAEVTALQPGDCIDLPSDMTSINEVQKQPCTSPHDAEVFLNFNDTATGSYPIHLHFENLATDTCLPAASTYLGQDFNDRLDLDAGYLYPTSDSWTKSNDRGLTCYLHNHDDSKLTQPLKSAGAQPS